MATIITRVLGATAKGTPLTNAEVDNNFINLNTEVGQKMAKSANLNDLADLPTARTNLQVYSKLETDTQIETAAVLNITGNSGTDDISLLNNTLSVVGEDGVLTTVINNTITINLDTVNDSIGSFGDSVTVPNFTVNAKGLITEAGSTAIPAATTSALGLAKFDTNNFSVTDGLVAITVIDGGIY